MTRHRLSSAWQYALTILAAAFFLMPVYVMVVTGLKPYAEVSLPRMWDLPRAVSLDNFVAAYRLLRGNLLNSLVVAVVGAVGAAFLGSLNGYVLAKWRFPGANIVFGAILFGMFIPYQSVLIPLVRFMQEARLYGGLPGLILTHVVYGIPITTLIFRNYFATVPTEVLDSARMDGAGILGIYRHIMLPIAAPGFAVTIIWQFTSLWNDFLFAVALTEPRYWPVTVALQNLAGARVVEWNVQMAGALLAALPTLLVYILMGRFFLRGLMAGALKG